LRSTPYLISFFRTRSLRRRYRPTLSPNRLRAIRWRKRQIRSPPHSRRKPSRMLKRRHNQSCRTKPPPPISKKLNRGGAPNPLQFRPRQFSSRVFGRKPESLCASTLVTWHWRPPRFCLLLPLSGRSRRIIPRPPPTLATRQRRPAQLPHQSRNERLRRLPS